MYFHSLKFFILVLLLLLSNQLRSQQDSASDDSAEEVIIASSNMNVARSEVSGFRIRPKYRHIDMSESGSFFKIAYVPQITKYPNRDSPNGMGHTIMLSYERFIPRSFFSIQIENITRLYNSNQKGYDYIHKENLDGYPYRRTDAYANISTFNVSLRYYYDLKKRQKYKASGKNLFNNYVFVRLQDLLSYQEKTTTVFDSSSWLLIHQKVKKSAVSEPAYLMLGWGTQRKYLDRILLEVNAGIGFRTHHAFDSSFAQEIMFKMNFNVGFKLFE